MRTPEERLADLRAREEALRDRMAEKQHDEEEVRRKAIARTVDDWLEALPKEQRADILVDLAKLSSGANRKLIISHPLHPGDPDQPDETPFQRGTAPTDNDDPTQAD